MIILEEIKCRIATDPDWQGLDLADGVSFHIAVMVEPFLAYMLDGQKTIESRFSMKKIAPYNKVKPGDIVFLKKGPIVGCFTADWVKQFDLHETSVDAIRSQYGKGVCGDNRFWDAQQEKHYVTLVGVAHRRKLSPLHITKTDRRAWTPIQL